MLWRAILIRVISLSLVFRVQNSGLNFKIIECPVNPLDTEQISGALRHIRSGIHPYFHSISKQNNKYEFNYAKHSQDAKWALREHSSVSSSIDYRGGKVSPSPDDENGTNRPEKQTRIDSISIVPFPGCFVVIPGPRWDYS